MAVSAQAIILCREIEEIAPIYGCHVALTGGCLYRDGVRKDIDILFYRIRQVDKIDHDGLKAALQAVVGLTDIKGFGWLLKAKWKDMDVDMFFPEEIGGDEYNTGDE